MSDLVRANLKEIISLQVIIKTDGLHYKSKRRKVFNFEYSLPVVFLRDIDEGQLSLEDTDEKQSNFASKLQKLSKSKKAIEKDFSKITLDYYLVQEKKFLITLKADYFQ